MARIVPGARLVYLVRDPVERAVSQYLYHRAEGTERRPIKEALLDPGSQYLARSHFYARLKPYLARFLRERIFVCALEELLMNRRATLRELYRFAGVNDSFWSPAHSRRWHDSRRTPTYLGGSLRRRLMAELSEDAARLQGLVGREFLNWQLLRG